MVSLIALVACTALLGGAAIAGLLALSHHFQTAEDQYRELRSVYEIGFRAAAIRQLLQTEPTEEAAIRRHLFLAAEEARKLDASLGARPDPQLHALCASISDRLNAPDGGLAADANAWLNEVTTLSATAQRRIVENREQANAQFRMVVLTIAGLLAATVVVAVVVGIRQYRSVMHPVRALDRAVALLADIRLGHQMEEAGDIEFRRLMHHFNRMSRALEQLHSSMQHQVELKSRQLVRSEQLASVGTLAAGLAHEINNPLAIIAGYAQTALRKLDRVSGDRGKDEAIDRARATLTVICEEAFRCKDIAMQLVRMAQPIEGEPSGVVIDEVARHAIELVGRLPCAHGKTIAYRCSTEARDLEAAGRAPQLLQVILNLLTNALEACDSADGRVVVSIDETSGKIMVSVQDNGCGMTEESVAQAFDPFYTDKASRGLDGCGLGLSISHAIIERHAGRIYAHSDGPGLGSTFTVELPVMPSRTTLSSPHGAHAHA